MHKNKDVDQFLNPTYELNPNEFANQIVQLAQSYKIVKRIPKGARNSVAIELSKLMAGCVKSNTFSNWQKLLLLPCKLLAVPLKKKTNGKSLVRLIKDNCIALHEESSESVSPHLEQNNCKTNKINNPMNISRIVESKLAEFDIFLPVESSSVAVERDFSDGVDIVTPNRHRLIASTVRMKMCLKLWCKV